MFGVVIGIIVVLAVVVLLAVSVKTQKLSAGMDFAPFLAGPIAHRGYFDNASDAPENTAAAFRLAVEKGLGMELDVQLSKDGQLIVFHDDTLDRATGVSGSPSAYTYAELREFPLFASQERIPLFTEVLSLVDGKVPLVIEVKPEGDWKRSCEVLAEILETYQGEYCVESFHPLAMQWFRKNRPGVVRGQLSTNYKKCGIEASLLKRFVLSNLLMNGFSQPHFIAYDYRFVDQWGYRLCRALYKPLNVAWTARDQKTYDACREMFDVIIFDSFYPTDAPKELQG